MTGTQRAVGEQAQQVGHRLGEQLGTLHDVHQPEADDGLAARHQRARHRSASAESATAIPNTASRPSGASAARLWSNTRAAGHLEHDVDPAAAVRLAQRGGQVVDGRVDGGVGTEFAGAARACSALDAVAITRPAPHRLASWIGDGADPAGARVHDHRLAGLQVRRWCAAGARRSHPARAWSAPAASLTPSGTGNSRRGSAATRSAYPPPPSRPSNRLPSAARTHHLAAGDQRQRLLGQVGVLGRVGVGVVDAGGQHVEHLLAVAGLGIGQVAHHERLGSAELGDLDRRACRRPYPPVGAQHGAARAHRLASQP